MKATFASYAFEELKAYINQLLVEGKSFSVQLIVDVNNQPHHWEVETGEY